MKVPMVRFSLSLTAFLPMFSMILPSWSKQRTANTRMIQNYSAPILMNRSASVLSQEIARREHYIITNH